MNWYPVLAISLALLAVPVGFRSYRRLQLSLAKHPSLRGHSRISRRLARIVPYYEYDEARIYRCDGAGDDVAARRKDWICDAARPSRGQVGKQPGTR